MSKRKGAAKGSGSGYKNLPNYPKDPKVHSMSAKGMKQPQKVQPIYNERKLTIVPTFVPRGSGNNPLGGKRDLLYKIKEWGFIFPSQASAIKYANEHIEINGIIVEKNKDTDGDGVPDAEDCQPMNPNKQDDWKKGDRVKVSSENDNENYDSFRGKTLIITHVAENIKEHPGYDESLNGEKLYDFITEDGEEVPFSLYEYELEDI